MKALNDESKLQKIDLNGNIYCLNGHLAGANGWFKTPFCYCYFDSKSLLLN